MVGHDRAFSLELAKRGWLGMTWPVEAGGGGRPPIERLLVFEALISEGAPVAASWFADRQMGPTLLQFGTAEQRDALPPGDPRRHRHVGHRDERARRRVQRGRHPHASRARRRRLPRDRPEDLDLGRGAGRPRVPDRPHRSRRPAPPGPVRAGRRPAQPRRHHPADHRHDGQPPLLRGLLRGRPGAGREPRRRAQRQLPAGDAADGARARRHRPPRVEPAAVRRHPTPGRHQRSARPPGARRDRVRVSHRPAARAPRGAGPGAQPVLRRDQDLLHRARAAGGALLRVGARPRRDAGRARPVRTGGPQPLLRHRLHDHGRHVADPAQHHRRARPGPSRRSRASRSAARRGGWAAAAPAPPRATRRPASTTEARVGPHDDRVGPQPGDLRHLLHEGADAEQQVQRGRAPASSR